MCVLQVVVCIVYVCECVRIAIFCVCVCVCGRGYIQWLDLCEERLFEIATYSGLFIFSPQ